jgi:PAS domain S-box-containing protein
MKSLSLRKRILWLFILSTIAISLISITLILHDVIRKAREEIQDQTRALAVAMLPMLNNTLVIGDLATVQQTFEGLVRDARIQRLALLDSKDRHPLIDIVDAIDSNPDNKAPQWFQSLFNIKVPPHEHRIQIGGVDYGVMLVEISTETLVHEIWHSLLYLLTLGGIALIVGLILLSAILSRGLAPLFKLAQMAERFGAGEFSQRAPTVDVPEIAVTAQAFNNMADNISSLLERVQRSEETNRQLASIVEQSEEAMLTVDLNGCVTSWNLGAEKLYGYARKDALGKPITFLLPPNCSPSELTNLLQHNKHHLRTRRYEIKMLDFYGRLLDIAMTATPLLNSKEEHIGEICIGRDITERKQFEHDLLQAKETAESAMRAKAAFLAMMSHEIRTPMNGIIGMTRLTLATHLDEEQRDYLECVQSSADSLLIILNDILDLSKIEAGKLSLEITPLSINTLIRDITKLFAAPANSKEIILKANIAPDIPSHLLGDPVRLRQIISNLLNNALKFTYQGSIAIDVTPNEINRENYYGLHFSIRDTGIGIPEDKLELIFAPFSQADSSTTRHFGGTGLGLTISSRLIELMNGKIWVESTVGVGSIFHFTVELELLDQESLISLQNQEQISQEIEKKYQIKSSIEENKTYHILLVEDNIFNQKVASILLKKMGYQVSVANDGLEAIKSLKSYNYDIVLMDMQMPNLDGLEATRQIRAANSQVKNPLIPIVAMTANAMQGDRESCLQAGMNDYVSKPINVDDLQAVLKKTLAS